MGLELAKAVKLDNASVILTALALGFHYDD
jgi:hypothetical protein